MKALPRYLLQKINYCWAFVVEKDTPVKVPVTCVFCIFWLIAVFKIRNNRFMRLASSPLPFFCGEDNQRIQLKRMLIKVPVPTPQTIVQHYFRLTCRK